MTSEPDVRDPYRWLFAACFGLVGFFVWLLLHLGGMSSELAVGSGVVVGIIGFVAGFFMEVDAPEEDQSVEVDEWALFVGRCFLAIALLVKILFMAFWIVVFIVFMKGINEAA